MHALDLLTEDCWKEILKRVKDPKDLWSCSEACLTFQEILRKKRNQFMFDLILPIIKEYLPAPYPYPELAQWRSLLKCRVVCKSWCESIDKLRDAEEERVFQQPIYQFDSGEKTEQFLQTFSNHTGNPFLGRGVTLHQRTHLLLTGNQPEALNAYGDEEAFHIRKMRELLERFGNQIWNLDLVGSELGDDIHDWKLSLCKNIQTVLGHLPNLRSLRLWFHFGRVVDNDDEELERRNMADQELTSYIAANPLPDLPQLEHIRTYCVNVGMMRLILEKYAPNLTSLILDDPSGFPEQGLQMSNLNKLEFTHLGAHVPLGCLRQLQAPQLRTLDLNVGSFNNNDVELWPIDELFRNIQHLPIRHLELIVQTTGMFLGESAPIPPDQRAYHGSISSIFLDCPKGAASFNFLLYCPQLTRAVLEHDYQGELSGHPNGVPELLDVRGRVEQVERDFYQSNIWEHLPLLEHLTIGGVIFGVGEAYWKWDDYDRDEYEERQKQLGD